MNIEPIVVSSSQLNDFVTSHPYGSLYQTTYYGDAAVDSREVDDYLYVTVGQNTNEILGSVLVTLRKTPLVPIYYGYIHHGFVVNYDEGFEQILDKLWEEMLRVFKSKGILYFGFDLKMPSDRTDVYNYFLDKNARHSKQYKDNIHSSWWKYSSHLDISADIEDVKMNLHKSTRNLIRKSNSFALEIELGDERALDKLEALMRITEERNEFSNGDYLYPRMRTIFKQAHKDQKASIYLVKLIPAKTLEILEEDKANRLKEKEKFLKNAEKKKTQIEEVESIIEKLERQIVEVREIESTHPDGMYLCAAMTFNKKHEVDYLYAGSRNEARDFYPTYHLLWRIIEDAHRSGASSICMQGTDPDTEDTGLNHFKKRWGTETVEFSGDFDYVLASPLARLFRKYMLKHKRVYLDFSNQD